MLTPRGGACRVVGASEGPRLWGALWVQVLGGDILPLAARLTHRLSHARSREAAAAARCLRMGVNLLAKSLLQHLSAMAPLPQFADLWSRALLAFQVGCIESHQSILLACLCWAEGQSSSH